MNLKLNLNIDKITKDLKDFAIEAEKDLTEGVKALAASTHAKVKEWASTDLKSTQRQFLDSVGFEEIIPGVWVVSINEKGLFIEEGLPENFDMKPGLLKNAKSAKNGNKYRVIPFDYGKGPSQQTPQTQNLVSYLKRELKRENIPFKGIEKNADGSPRIGKLHTLDLGNPGGRMGSIGKGNTPVFKGLTIIQSQTSEGPRRDILTFRTVSSGPASSGKWIHPGLKAKKYLERAQIYAEQMWENEVLPAILSKWK